jgi:hypothetical protein
MSYYLAIDNGSVRIIVLVTWMDSGLSRNVLF